MSSEKLTREQIKRIVEEVVDQVVGTEEQYQEQEQNSLNEFRTWYIGDFKHSQDNLKAYVEISDNDGYKLSCNRDALVLYVTLMLGMIESLKLRYENIDSDELEKDSISADIKVNEDVSLYIDKLLKEFGQGMKKNDAWLSRCIEWKKKYPVVLKRHYQDGKPNIYVFFKEMTSRLRPDDALVVSVGTSRVVGSQASIIKEGMRFITNPVTAAMGFDLPAAIGVARARKGKRTILVTGEGSIQMNLQELETIIFNKMPVVIFLMNNEGYHSIRMTQNSYFGKPLVGVGPESGDLAFPDFSKIAYAYGIDYKACKRSQDLDACIDWALENKNICVCELFLSKEQVTEPKVASRKLADGKMISATLENMAPFLSEEEIKANMVD